MNDLRVLDLFSGIGGFSLGLKRAGGFRTVAYCEIEPYCQEVLRARMQDGSLDTAPICTDIRRLDGKTLRGVADFICGGFPCPDISCAGKGAGSEGPRSILWREMVRLVCEIRPKLILMENAPMLLSRGLGRILGKLAEIGYDAEWDCVSAAAFGAHHLRDRIWIVSYPYGQRWNIFAHDKARRRRQGVSDKKRIAAQDQPEWASRHSQAHAGTGIATNPDTKRREIGKGRGANPLLEWWGMLECNSSWDAEPGVGRVVHGIPDRVDRSRVAALGNAVVPQVVEWIGQRINEMRV